VVRTVALRKTFLDTKTIQVLIWSRKGQPSCPAVLAGGIRVRAHEAKRNLSFTEGRRDKAASP